MEMLAHIFATQKLTSGEAAKLRGKLGALDCSLFGRILRGALVALSARQYWESTELHQTLLDALAYIKSVVQWQPPR
eukprot:275511-Karenia_brevis.AAC.1